MFLKKNGEQKDEREHPGEPVNPKGWTKRWTWTECEPKYPLSLGEIDFIDKLNNNFYNNYIPSLSEKNIVGTESYSNWFSPTQIIHSFQYNKHRERVRGNDRFKRTI